jgi:hypothetical protein
VATRIVKARTRENYVPSEKQRASDEKLRDELRHFDLKNFDQVLEKAIQKGKSG